MNPICAFLFQKMEKQGMSINHVARVAGVNNRAIQRWKTRNSPQLTSIEACLNVVGYTLKPVLMKDGNLEGDSTKFDSLEICSF